MNTRLPCSTGEHGPGTANYAGGARSEGCPLLAAATAALTSIAGRWAIAQFPAGSHAVRQSPLMASGAGVATICILASLLSQQFKPPIRTAHR
jgi:hypothetical protein